MRKCHFVGDHAAQAFAGVMRLFDAECVPENKNILREIGKGHLFFDTAESCPAVATQVQRPNTEPVSKRGNLSGPSFKCKRLPCYKGKSGGVVWAVQRVIGFETVHIDLRHSMFLWARYQNCRLSEFCKSCRGEN